MERERERGLSWVELVSIWFCFVGELGSPGREIGRRIMAVKSKHGERR